MRAYSFAVVTGLMFLLAWAGQFVFQLMVATDEARSNGEAFAWSRFWPQFLASTLENWQSEALQLVWQTAGLAFLYFWGSSQSREGADRVEAKVDELLRRTPDRRMYRDDSMDLPRE
jgi:hypothetical protein